ncbi:MAG: hypothetical protein AAGF94_08040 [Pseudomonadota bacterium]
MDRVEALKKAENDIAALLNQTGEPHACKEVPLRQIASGEYSSVLLVTGNSHGDASILTDDEVSIDLIMKDDVI